MNAQQAIMEDIRMVQKANQIAAFFEHYPHNKAVDGIAEHLQKFWTSAMRHQLKDYITGDNGANLNSLIIEAASKL